MHSNAFSTALSDCELRTKADPPSIVQQNKESSVGQYDIKAKIAAVHTHTPTCTYLPGAKIHASSLHSFLPMQAQKPTYMHAYVQTDRQADKLTYWHTCVSTLAVRRRRDVLGDLGIAGWTDR